MGKLIGICGPIGAGKSTLIRTLREEHPEWTAVPEIIPPDLAGYYADLRARAMDMQLRILRQRVTSYKEAARSEAPVVLLDRLPWEDAEVMAPHAFDEVGVPGWERLHYRAVAVRLLAGLRPPDLVVALRSADSTVLERRVAGRGRAGEELLPEGYLRRLAGRYRTWPQAGRWPVLPVSDASHAVPLVLAAVKGVLADAEAGDGAEAIPGGVSVTMD